MSAKEAIMTFADFYQILSEAEARRDDQLLPKEVRTRSTETVALCEERMAKMGLSRSQLIELATGYAFNDLAGCVVQRKNRITGLLVGLYNAGQAGMDEESGKWATVCETHSTICNHETLAAAKSHLADPTMWCEECQKNFS
jgi:hypothetical protein